MYWLIALQKQYEADIAEHTAVLKTFVNNAVGVADHDKFMSILKDRVNNAETETAVIKATGMISPEMKALIEQNHRLIKRVDDLKKEVCEVRQDNRKLSKQIEDGIDRMRKAGLLW